MAQAATAPGSPWSSRLFDSAPLSPIWVGVGLALALLLLFFGVEYASGQVDRVLTGEAEDHIGPHFRLAVINSFLVSFLLTAQCYLARWTRNNVAAIRPLLGPGEGGAAEELPDLDDVVSRPSRAAGLIGIAALIVLFYLLPGDVFRFFELDYWIFEHAWEHSMTIVIGWLTGRVGVAMVSDSLRVSRLASRIRRIDLFDPGALFPFVRQGLRSALLAIVLVSLASANLWNILVDPLPFAIALPVMLAVAVVSLVLPVRGVNRRIRDEKQRELAALRTEIRAGRNALERGGSEGDRAAVRLPAQLALEARIDGVREWPFDASSMLRLALYVGVGLGSWLGAAAVERLVDRALG